MNSMISFRVESHRFQYRAAAVVIEQGKVLLHRLQGESFWALPGGRVHAGETAAATLQREFREELGVALHSGPMLSVGENFFEADGEPHHEIGLYLSARLPEGVDLADKTRVHMGVEGDRSLEFRWFPLDELPRVDMRPAVLRDSLARGALPQHFVQDHPAGY